MRERALQERHGLAKRGRPLGVVRASYAHRDRLDEAAGLEQMVRDLDRLRTFMPKQGVGGASVQLLPARGDRVAGDRLLRERMPPPVSSRSAWLLLDELLLEGRIECAMHDFVVHIRDSDQGRIVECSTQHGRGLEDDDDLVVQALEPQPDRVANRGRNAELVDRLSIPASIGPEDVYALERLLEHLFEYKGISLAALAHEPGEVLADVVCIEDRGDDRAHLGDGKRFELDDFRGP